MERNNDFTREEKDKIAQLVYEHLILEDGGGSHKLVYELFKVLRSYRKRIDKKNW